MTILSERNTESINELLHVLACIGLYAQIEQNEISIFKVGELEPVATIWCEGQGAWFTDQVQDVESGNGEMFGSMKKALAATITSLRV